MHPNVYVPPSIFFTGFAYGPKTEVAKRFFFESDVLDATLMMGWGGVGWGGVGWGMLTFV